MSKLKPPWQKTDIPKDIKLKLWRIMKDNPTYDTWLRGIADLQYGLDKKEEDKYVKISRETHKRLQEEIKEMPVSEVCLLPIDLQVWVKGLRPDIKGKLELGEKQQNQVSERHINSLIEVADSLRFNLKVPSPKSAQEDELVMDDEKYKRLSGLQALEAAAKDASKAAWPGPKWYFIPDGSIVVGYITEDFRYFPALMEHLKSTNLDRKFYTLKRSLMEYISLCHSLKDEVKEVGLFNIPQVSDLYGKSQRLTTELTTELKEFILKGSFPGRCRYCPDSLLLMSSSLPHEIPHIL